MTLTDGQLVERVRNGDRDAFGDLVGRYRDMVYGLGYHLTHDFEAARDLAQEAFVQAYLKLGQIRDPDKFSGWLRQIATNVHRAHQRRREVATVTLDDAGAVPDTRHPSEIEVVVRDALNRLSAPERLALTLHYINGYSHGEIGEFLGVRPETVKTRLARARQHLRKEMMQTVDDVFEQNALPKEFREDVVRAVNEMVGELQAVLPEDWAEIRQQNRKQANTLWRAILAKMPAELQTLPLQDQGHARQVKIAGLPEDVQRDIRQAACHSWVDYTFLAVGERLPWSRDLGRLWIRFSSVDGKPQVELSSVPEGSGYRYAHGIGPDDSETVVDKNMPSADIDQTVGPCEIPREITDALTRLRALMPAKAGSTRAALYAEMARLMRQINEMLPSETTAAMEAGRSFLAADLPQSTQVVLRKAIAMEWGYLTLFAVEFVPPWLLHLEDSCIEFGIYPTGPGLEAIAGESYVRLSAPERDGTAAMVTVISERFDRIEPT